MHVTRDHDAIHAKGNNRTKPCPISHPFTACFLNIRANLINLPIRVYSFLLYSLEYVEITRNQACKHASEESF